MPFEEFEEVFSALVPANDGQYKVQVFEQMEGTEALYCKRGKI